MERMSNELQELVQRDTRTKDEEETDPLLAITNWDENLPAPSITSSLEQPVLSTPSPWFAGILESEEEKANVKEYVTSRLPAPGHGEGWEASGSSGRPAIPEFKFGGSFMACDGGAEEVKKTALVPPKAKKRGVVEGSDGKVWMEVEGLLSPC